MKRAFLMGIMAGLALTAAALTAQQKNIPGSASPPAEQQIDKAIGEMLAAWQIGDSEMLHRYFDENVSVVSGDFEPPIYGWANYVQAYRRQRDRLQQVRLERRNTYMNQRGNWAWAGYQWELFALADNTPGGWRGHTSMVLEKKGDRWLIVHNHTSVVAQASAPAAPPPAPPAKPAR